MPELSDEDTLRIDIWLWRARFFRTRALASDHVARRGVRITRNGHTRKTDKPGTRITCGDVLLFKRQPDPDMIEIVELGTRRGPATEAAGLYRRIDNHT